MRFADDLGCSAQSLHSEQGLEKSLLLTATSPQLVPHQGKHLPLSRPIPAPEEIGHVLPW